MSTRAGGSSATVRTVALRKGRAKATSRTFTVVRRGGAAPGTPGRVAEPPAAPGTTPPPAGAAPAAGPSSTLSAGETLAPGAELRSPNGRYRLAMQETDGNLVLYDGSSALWSTGGYGPGTSLTTQADGNVVGHRDGVARWSTTTTGFDGARLVLQDDGNLVVYRGGQPLWTWGSGYVGDRLEPGQGLAPGSFLRSADGRFRMLMQPEDGNLVLYEGSTALWSTGGSGAGAGVTMQEDGNFVVYQGGVARWHAQTTGFGGARFVLQDDANAVIYHSGHAIWTRGSGYTGDTLNAGGVLQPGAFLRSPSGAWTLLMQPGDGNLVLYATGGAAHWQFGTSGAPGAHAIMQPDGNFVVYANGQARNSTKTGSAGSYFRVQDDANLVVYAASGPAQWARFGISAPEAQGPVNIRNAGIADRAEARANGAYGDQCLVFASDMIVEAGGPRWYFGFDVNNYNQQWAQRATEIPSPSLARRGDIVQWTGGRTPHTAIVTQAGQNPSVIDSNFAGTERVGRGTLSSREVGGTRKIWRVGKL